MCLGCRHSTPGSDWSSPTSWNARNATWHTKPKASQLQLSFGTALFRRTAGPQMAASENRVTTFRPRIRTIRRTISSTGGGRWCCFPLGQGNPCASWCPPSSFPAEPSSSTPCWPSCRTSCGESSRRDWRQSSSVASKRRRSERTISVGWMRGQRSSWQTLRCSSQKDSWNGWPPTTSSMLPSTRPIASRNGETASAHPT